MQTSGYADATTDADGIRALKTICPPPPWCGDIKKNNIYLNLLDSFLLKTRQMSHMKCQALLSQKNKQNKNIKLQYPAIIVPQADNSGQTFCP